MLPETPRTQAVASRGSPVVNVEAGALSVFRLLMLTGPLAEATGIGSLVRI